MDILANRFYSGGRIKDKCERAGVNERLILIERQYKGALVILHNMDYLPVAFHQLWSHERLLNVVEQLIGPDIAGKVRKNTNCWSKERTFHKNKNAEKYLTSSFYI